MIAIRARYWNVSDHPIAIALANCDLRQVSNQQASAIAIAHRASRTRYIVCPPQHKSTPPTRHSPCHTSHIRHSHTSYASIYRTSHKRSKEKGNIARRPLAVGTYSADIQQKPQPELGTPPSTRHPIHVSEHLIAVVIASYCTSFFSERGCNR